MATAMDLFGAGEWFLLVLWFGALIWPLTYAIRHKSSLALSLTVGLLLAYVVQVIYLMGMRQGLLNTDSWYMWADFWLVPSRTGLLEWPHTLISAGFLHNPFDPLHVLGNILVIALVGVPLEQRLGMKRFSVIYLIGLIGGSVSWWLMNFDSTTPSLGASGAAFGLFGAYLAGWPKDEIAFPLILIRKWPVYVIALIYFALEVARAYQTLGLQQASDVAHMAHLGGFLAAYLLLPLVARGGPYELGIDDGGPSSSSDVRSRLNQMKANMADLADLEDPWTANGGEPSRAVKETLQKLRASGDEPETRLAWMERLAEVAVCPLCGGQLGVVERKGGPQIQCALNPSDLQWP
jgi:membrane associated rhomboid family serine protease